MGLKMTRRDNQGSYWGSTESNPPNMESSFETPDSFNQGSFSSPQQPEAFSANEESQLVRELEEKQYHPILIFGTRASGKSSLLASLFFYLQSNPATPAIAILDDKFIVSLDMNYSNTVADAATHFFNHVINAFHSGEAAPSTRDEYPYYIPVILRPNNGQPEVRLAFLESRGEWYAIQHDSRDLYPALRNEVSDVYKNFSKSISILLIAPFVIGESYSEEIPSELAMKEMDESDAGIFGALQAYQQTREFRHLDNYLYILTKWDQYSKVITSPEFIRPPRGVVSNLIAERFPRSWTMFQAMQSGDAQSMQYSAGLMSGNIRVKKIDPNYKPILDQFPEMLWRWLYRNASGYELFYAQLNSNADSQEHLGHRVMALVRNLGNRIMELVRKILT
jgi:hypothetical protein